jgi:hypothetical protein
MERGGKTVNLEPTAHQESLENPESRQLFPSQHKEALSFEA